MSILREKNFENQSNYRDIAEIKNNDIRKSEKKKIWRKYCI